MKYEMPKKVPDIDYEISDFDNSPSYYLTTITNNMQKIAARVLGSELGLSVTEYIAVATSGAEPGCPPQRVIDIAGLDKSVVSRAIKSLIAKDVLKVVQDENNARKTNLYLTPKGLILHQKGIYMSSDGDNAMLTGFTDEQKKSFIEMLRMALKNVPLMGK